LHAVEPAVEAYKPTRQFLHAEVAAAENCPVGQLEHEGAPSDEKVPAGQAAQAERPCVDAYLPAEQPEQLKDLVPVANIPTLHFVHVASALPGTLEYVPPWHTSQVAAPVLT